MINCKTLTLFTILILSGFPSTGLTSSRTVANIVWLGTPTENQLDQWRSQGFTAERLSCESNVTACLHNALADNEGANYLFVDSAFTEHLLILYTTETLNEISGVILFGAAASELSIRPRGRRPKLLVVAEADADAELVYQSRRTATLLSKRGVPATFMFMPNGELRSTNMGPMAQDIILHFFGLPSSKTEFMALLDAYLAWRSPPFDNQPFRSHFDLLESYRLDSSVEGLFRYFFRNQLHELKQWKFDNYLAFDLLKFRDRTAPDARYLTLANRRGQQYYLDLDRYAAYEPVIIVGVDDEPNMYRFVWFYRTHKMYTWEEDVPEISARSLGPVLHFRKRVPDDLTIPLLLRSALSLDGITFSHDNPLAEIAAYSDTIRKVITSENKCVYCHPIGTKTARAYHLNALSGKPQGGYGLPLSEYPDHVMRAFLFDQKKVADTIGMIPNPLHEDAVDE
ncbi:MAG: hypothetical protein O7F71_21520, partial [Gammaproteobacteria bacterium]|nr:hypothetical protein [Gammaproteobacteria bacterium]